MIYESLFFNASTNEIDCAGISLQHINTAVAVVVDVMAAAPS